MATSLKASKTPAPTQDCPCGTGKKFGDCCEQILTGRRTAVNAEELMRARFTAHVIHDFRFLHESFRPTAGKPYVEDEGEPSVTWTKLVVHGHEVTSDPDKAFVDFSAYGTEDKVEKVLHEKAEFVRVDGNWLYNREARLGPAPYKSSAPKVGRNDPCPCGSGKKYKQCCLQKA
jgi:SEC-C motif-containing protein